MNSPRIDFMSDRLNPFDNADMQFFRRNQGQNVTGLTSGGNIGADRFKINISGTYQYNTQGAVSNRPTPGNTGGVLKYPLAGYDSIDVDAVSNPVAANFFSYGQFMEARRVEWMLYKRMKFGFICEATKPGIYTAILLGQDVEDKYVVPFTVENTLEKTFVQFEVDMEPYRALSPFVASSIQGLYFGIVLSAGPDITNVVSENQWVKQAAIGGNSLRAAAGQVNMFDNTNNGFWVTGFRAVGLDYAGQEVDLWAQKPISPQETLWRNMRYMQIRRSHQTYPALHQGITTSGTAFWHLDQEMRAVPQFAFDGNFANWRVYGSGVGSITDMGFNGTSTINMLAVGYDNIGGSSGAFSTAHFAGVNGNALLIADANY